MRKLRTQLSVGFAMIVLVTVLMISLTANLGIHYQFDQYMGKRREQEAGDLAEGLSLQYDRETGRWNLDYIHGFGMYALNDGYIIKVTDADGNLVWDARNHDMSNCHQMMEGIFTRLESGGEYVSLQYELVQDGVITGYADIGYYGSCYYEEDEFDFIQSLNGILLVIGLLSLFGAAAAGIALASRISRPVRRVTEITSEIAEGNYGIRFQDRVNTAELEELTRSVNHMALTLGRQEGLRKRLTTDVAHELRTPLANIASCLEAFMEGVWEPTAKRLKSCYEEIGRLTGLVADLEQLWQTESETLNREPVELKGLADTVGAVFEPGLREKGLSLVIEGEPAVICGDKERLYQVVFNLLSNAVKYSREGGQIRITVGNGNETGILTVEDDGIGISPDDLPFIFERFYRADCSRSRKTGGAGIGLSITKSIVQAHGGRITAESREGEGSRFRVILPKAGHKKS